MKTDIVKISLGLLLLITVTSATDPEAIRWKNVSFVDIIKSKPQCDGNSFEMFIDGEGFIYPDKNTGIHFFNQLEHINVEARFDSFFRKRPDSLKEVFKEYRLECNSKNGADSIKIYEKFVFDRFINTLNECYKKSGCERMLFAIHGFNNQYYDQTCERLIPRRCKMITQQDIDINSFTSNNKLVRMIETLHSDKRVFVVKVYWDGLFDSLEKNVDREIWTSAQSNSYYTGLALRRTINALDPTIKTDMITHSLGANVACAALFNMRSKLEYWEIPTYQSMRGTIPLIDNKYRKIRVAMIAPAIPGENTFIDFVDKDLSPNAGDYKFIVGFNIHDRATAKRSEKVDKAKVTRYFGSTSLASLKSEKRRVKKVMSNRLTFIDFSEYKQSSHRFIDYMDRPKMTEVLDSLFTN